MASYAGSPAGNNCDERDERYKAVDKYGDAMKNLEPVLKVLQDNKMACVRCPEEHTCEFRYDLYNFGEDPQVSCLAMK